MRHPCSSWLLGIVLVFACGDDGSPPQPEFDGSVEPSASASDGAVLPPSSTSSDGSTSPHYDAGMELDARARVEMDATTATSTPPVSSPPDANYADSAVVSDFTDSAVVSDAASAQRIDASTSDQCIPGACPHPNYPCAPSDDGMGYSCLGQFAAWPMPDSQPGAKVAPRYTPMPDAGVVLDEVTGLLWQRDLPKLYAGCTRRLKAEPGDGCTWSEAHAYCAQLTTAGRSWRLPSKVEMESLLDATALYPAPRIDGEVFPNMPIDPFWTGLRGGGCGGDQDACQLLAVLGFASSAQNVNEAALVRCVHSERVPNARPGTRFQREDDVIRDRFTTLAWHAQRSPETPLPEDADSYCASLEGGFRVPTTKELASLADEGSATAADDPIFDLQDGYDSFWSSTVSPVDLGRMFYHALTGLTAPQKILDERAVPFVLRVRCVQ